MYDLVPSMAQRVQLPFQGRPRLARCHCAPGVRKPRPDAEELEAEVPLTCVLERHDQQLFVECVPGPDPWTVHPPGIARSDRVVTHVDERPKRNLQPVEALGELVEIDAAKGPMHPGVESRDSHSQRLAPYVVLHEGDSFTAGIQRQQGFGAIQYIQSCLKRRNRH